MKRFIAEFFCVLALFTVSSCSNQQSPSDNSKWKNDVELAVLANELDGCLNIDTKYMEDVDDDWYNYVLCADFSLFESCLVRTSAKDSDISEYGIFKAGENQSTENISDMIKNYVKIKQDNWDDRYLQDQHSKLKNASVFSCGNYVFYTIMSDSEKTSFEQKATELLKID